MGVLGNCGGGIGSSFSSTPPRLFGRLRLRDDARNASSCTDDSDAARVTTTAAGIAKGSRGLNSRDAITEPERPSSNGTRVNATHVATNAAGVTAAAAQVVYPAKNMRIARRSTQCGTRRHCVRHAKA
jgi:hypothetical protein